MHLWLMQSGRELLSVFERQLVVAGDLNDCAAACTRSSSSFTCTAFSFDSAARTCALYDQVGTLDTDWPANVQRHSSANLYTRVCLIEKGSSEKENIDVRAN